MNSWVDKSEAGPLELAVSTGDADVFRLLLREFRYKVKELDTEDEKNK
jgi:hypothetical protein